MVECRHEVVLTLLAGVGADPTRRNGSGDEDLCCKRQIQAQGVHYILFILVIFQKLFRGVLHM